MPLFIPRKLRPRRPTIPAAEAARAIRGSRGDISRRRGGNLGNGYESFDNSISLSPFLPPDSLVGGRLRFFSSAWSQISDDPCFFNIHFEWFDPRISFSPPGQTLKIEGLCTVRELLRQNDWVAKIDLKDAYLTVPISTAFLHFLRFIWKGRICQYPIWPFPRRDAKLRRF